MVGEIMEHEILEEKIMTQGEAVEKLELLLSKDHEETMKQRHQIDELYKKLGNGWSAKVELGLDQLHNRVNDLEKTDIRMYEKLNTISGNVESLKSDISELKHRPRNNMVWLKDIVYLLVALISIGTFLFNGVI